MPHDISFASFNLYNLQLPGLATHPGAAPFTEESYARRLGWAGDLLKAADADVIAFQELWSRQALVDLFERSGLAADYQLCFIANDWYDIAVAAAVKRPWVVKGQQLHKRFPAAFRLLKRGHGEAGADAHRTDDDIDVQIDIFSRTVLQLTVGKEEAGAPELDVFCTHLKSKLATQLDKPEQQDDALKPHRAALGAALSTVRRTAEAAALRMILTGLMKGSDRAVAVIGDFNDGNHSNTLSILTGQPAYRQYYAHRAGISSDAGLYSASFLQALGDFQDVAYSHIHQGVREQLDHVLVSEQFYDHSKHRLWSFHDQRIWNDHVVEEGPNGPARTTSDHGIVRARFDWQGPQ